MVAYWKGWDEDGMSRVRENHVIDHIEVVETFRISRKGSLA